MAHGNGGVLVIDCSMEKQEHTPTPWTYNDCLTPANAAFVVRAVNCHEALSRVVKEYRATLTGAVGRSLDALIAEAEGK